MQPFCRALILNDDEKITNDKRRFEDLLDCSKKQHYFGEDGLYFCGYWVSPTGQIREVGPDAIRIAGDIAGKERHFRNYN